MTSHEAVLARQEAVETLKGLLQTPEDLRKLDSLRDMYMSEQKANSQLLASVLRTHINEGRGTLENLSTAKDASARLVSDFDTIEDLCRQCFETLTCKGDISRLGDVHANLRAVLLHADAISSLPAKAADVERRLSYSGAETLVEVYIRLAELEATVSQIEAALEGIPLSAAAQQQVANLDFYFDQVRRAMGQMEEHIWSILRGYYRIARQNPSLLVAALQIIEIQEGIDKQLMAGQGNSKSRKGWRRRCLQQLEASVMEIFAPVLQEASKLVDENTPPGVLLPTVLRECTKLVADLRIVKEHVGSCFPPSYNVTEVICKEYHTQLESLFQLLGLCAENLSNADVLLVLGWVDTYYNMLRNLGLNALTSTLTFSDETGSGLQMLLDVYMTRVAGTFSSWISNIVEKDFSQSPQASQSGHLWTPGPVDLFRILDEQLDLASPAGWVLVQRVLAQAKESLKTYQNAVQEKLASLDPPLEVLCATANNCLRCQALGLEYKSRVYASFPSKSTKEQDDLVQSCQVFVDVADVALVCCVDAVFADPGFGELFKKIGCSSAWVSGTVTGSVLATLDDFMQDFRRWLQTPLYNVFVELLLGDTVSRFIAAIITQLRRLGEEEFHALNRDKQEIEKFFRHLVPTSKQAAAGCQPLTSIVDFLSSDSVESFILSYSTLLEATPGMSPVLLSNLLAARVASDDNMTKADAKEVLDACREFYAARGEQHKPASSYVGGSSKMRFHGSGENATYLAALNAVRRRWTTD